MSVIKSNKSFAQRRGDVLFSILYVQHAISENMNWEWDGDGKVAEDPNWREGTAERLCDLDLRVRGLMSSWLEMSST